MCETAFQYVGLILGKYVSTSSKACLTTVKYILSANGKASIKISSPPMKNNSHSDYHYTAYTHG
jgi:hypothetical protein